MIDQNKLLNIFNDKTKIRRLEYSSQLYLLLQDRYVNTTISLNDDIVFRSLFESLYSTGGGLAKKNIIVKDNFYKVFEEYKQKNKSNITFSYSDIVQSIYNQIGSKEIVYASKMYHTIDQTKAIIDNNLNDVFFPDTGIDYVDEIKKSFNKYYNWNKVFNSYVNTSSDATLMENLFNQYLQTYNSLNKLKKIDFILWLYKY